MQINLSWSICSWKHATKIRHYRTPGGCVNIPMTLSFFKNNNRIESFCVIIDIELIPRQYYIKLGVTLYHGSIWHDANPYAWYRVVDYHSKYMSWKFCSKSTLHFFCLLGIVFDNHRSFFVKSLYSIDITTYLNINHEVTKLRFFSFSVASYYGLLQIPKPDI